MGEGISDGDIQLAWAAGLFEGEGCISYKKGSRKNSPGYCLPRISLTSTDRDVIDRFCRVVGAGNVRDIKRKNAPSHWKKAWRWEANGKSAVDIMEAIYPLLGERRRARWGEVKDLMGENIARYQPPATCTVAGCDDPGYSRKMCHRHYRQWHYRTGGKVQEDHRYNEHRKIYTP